jgi:hypothetical protein
MYTLLIWDSAQWLHHKSPGAWSFSTTEPVDELAIRLAERRVDIA